MFCYCNKIFWSNIAASKSPYDELLILLPDGEDHCWDWFKDYSLAKTLLYSVPLSILFVNFLSKTFLRVITKLNGYQSKPEEVHASAVNMFLMSFINTGIVIQLVYFDWAPNFEIPLLLAEY
jgi:hypothetical protein